MSPRSLQRALRTEGTSFRRLRDEARSRLARHFLTATELPTEEVAYLIGIDDVSSLFRAARRWEDCTPADLRRAEGRIQPGAAVVGGRPAAPPIPSA